MTHREIYGGWYVDAVPGGAYAALVPSRQAVETLVGDVAYPAGHGEPLYVRLTIEPRFKFSGQGHDSGAIVEFDSLPREFHLVSPTSYGTNPVIYGLGGTLYLGAPEFGSQGFRYVRPDGSIVTSDETGVPLDGLTQWTDLGDDLRIGQGAASGGVVVRDGQTLRLLHPGECYAIRAVRSGPAVSVAFYEVAADGLSAHVYELTVSDLRALPVLDETEPLDETPQKAWLAFFSFGDDASVAAISNASLLVDSVPVVDVLEVRDRRDGSVVMTYVAAEVAATKAALDEQVRRARAAFPGVPVVPYWSGSQPWTPDGEWPGIECYWKTDETLAQAEARWRRAIVRALASPTATGVVLVCQCYTSNAGQSTLLKALVPVYSRLRRLDGVKGLLVFSGSGRATGLQDHPDVRPLWAQLAASVRVPDKIVVVPPQKPEPPTVPIPIPIPPRPPKPEPSKPTPPTASMPLAAAYRGPMRVFLKQGSKFVGVSPSAVMSGKDKKTPTFPIYSDRASGGDWEVAELERRDDGSFSVKFAASNKVLSQNPNGALESRDAAGGPWETFYAARQPQPGEIAVLYRIENGVMVSPVLTIVEA